MKKKRQVRKEQPHNPYEKVFDDAGRSLKKFGGMKYLDSIPDDRESNQPKIPFPYGSSAVRPYNFNST